MAKTPLGRTQCHYVSADGDERVTTVDEVHMASVVAGQPVRPIRSFAGQKHYPGLFWSVTTTPRPACWSITPKGSTAEPKEESPR